MPAINVRNLSDETHRALKARATQHGRSMEAEVRAILDESLQPRTGIGTKLVELFQREGGVELDIVRDRTPGRPISFD